MNEKADLLPEQRFLRSILNTRELYSASSGLLCGSFASGRCCRHQGGILAHSNTGGVQGSWSGTRTPRLEESLKGIGQKETSAFSSQNIIGGRLN